MIIELHGADFRNKGGELMLRATVSEIKERLPNAQFVIDPLVGSFSERSELGLLQHFPPRGWMGSRNFKYLFPLQKFTGSIVNSSSFLKKICKRYGIVTIKEVDALIDISGFAFTSQWGHKPCLDFSSLAEHYRKRNKPVIMLPQAFGPFDSPEIKKGIGDIKQNASLIYARDNTSHRYLKEVDTQTSDNVKRAPDITFFYPSIKNSNTEPNYDNECLIIPNIRMLDQGAEGWGNKYVQTLTNIIGYLDEKELKAAILIHDATGKDFEIAKQVRNNLKEGVEVYNISDPLAIKKKIATAPFLVTSRYHGAIAAFSQKVPSICMGWSHKYNELYSSFDMNGLMISSEDDFSKIAKRLDALTNFEKNKKLRKNISDLLKVSKKKNEMMWKTVVKELV